MEEEELASHTLALAATRPAMMPYVGIPWLDFIVLSGLAGYVLIFRWQFIFPLIVVVLAVIKMYRRDYNAGRCFMCWMETSGKHLGIHHLGGSFISPRPGRGYRGVIQP